MSRKDGEKVNVIVLLLILISIATLGIVFFYIAKFAGPIQGGVVSETETNSIEKVVYTQEETDTKNAECSAIGNINQKDWCLLDLAKEYSVDRCSEIEQPQFKSYCTAIITQNDKECEDIIAQNVKDACYISLAQETGKEKLCKKTSREEFCLSLIS